MSELTFYGVDVGLLEGDEIGRELFAGQTGERTPVIVVRGLEYEDGGEASLVREGTPRDGQTVDRGEGGGELSLP